MASQRTIEENLQSIADSLIIIAKHVDSAKTNSGNPRAEDSPTPQAPGTRTRAGTRKTTKAEGVATNKKDVTGNPPSQPVEPSHSAEEIREQVRQYALKFGKIKAVDLIIKYGAQKRKPLIKDVRPDKFADLVEEVESAVGKK